MNAFDLGLMSVLLHLLRSLHGNKGRVLPTTLNNTNVPIRAQMTGKIKVTNRISKAFRAKTQTSRDLTMVVRSMVPRVTIGTVAFRVEDGKKIGNFRSVTYFMNYGE